MIIGTRHTISRIRSFMKMMGFHNQNNVIKGGMVVTNRANHRGSIFIKKAMAVRRREKIVTGIADILEKKKRSKIRGAAINHLRLILMKGSLLHLHRFTRHFQLKPNGQKAIPNQLKAGNVVKRRVNGNWRLLKMRQIIIDGPKRSGSTKRSVSQ